MDSTRSPSAMVLECKGLSKHCLGLQKPASRSPAGPGGRLGARNPALLAGRERSVRFYTGWAPCAPCSASASAHFPMHRVPSLFASSAVLRQPRSLS